MIFILYLVDVSLDALFEHGLAGDESTDTANCF